MARRNPSTNDVVDLYLREKPRPKLMVKKLDRNTVLIEGSATALEFLGHYVIAHARGDIEDCGVGLSPKGAGSGWFTKNATLGFYLHRLPCRRGRRVGPRRKQVTRLA